MTGYLWTLIICACFLSVFAWSCTDMLPNVYAKENEQVKLPFKGNVDSANNLVLYEIKFYSDVLLLRVQYFNSAVFGTPAVQNCTFTGNYSTADLEITTDPVHNTSAGSYRLQQTRSGTVNVLQCITLFFLKKPQKAVLSHDSNNVLGRNSTLMCASASNTYPANHSLSFTYTWKVNGVMPADVRYVYSQFNKSLTIISLAKEDAEKRFMCSATENGNGVSGYTSDFSDEFILKVIYGPDSDTTKLVPANTKYTLNEGVELNDITCVGVCYPGCNFKWTKPGTNGAVTVSSNAVLSLGPLSRTEAATYTCEVTNPNNTLRTERKEVIVNVNYGPDGNTTTLSPTSTSYTLNTGDPINDIHCSGICYPSCNYKWTKSGNNGFTQVNSATLSLGSLDRTKAGTYTCTVSNPKTDRKLLKTVSVFVRYGPDISSTTLSPADTSYILKENTYLANITCMADCYPECSYKWTKPDNTLVSNNGVLSLGFLKRNKAGTYTCTVTRSGTSVSVTKQVTVFVIYGPDAGSLTLVPVKTTYTENEGMRLNDITCSAACYPECNYKWTNSRTNAEVGGVLSLGILNKNMAATYTCTATNPRDSRTAVKNVVLHVRYGPEICKFNVQSPLTLTEEDTSPLISCESDCYPSCSHTWTNMSSSSSVGGDGNFQLESTRYQAGYYQCLCKNTAAQYGKNQTSTLNVIIEYAPDVTVSLSTENITVGNSLTLSCDANGVPSVYQYKGLIQTWNAVIIPNTNRAVSGSPKHSTLHIPSLQLQNSGTYTCYVNNGVKTVDSTSSVNLKVRVFPKVLTPLLIFVGATGGIGNISVQFYSFPAVQEVVFQRYDNQTISNDTDKYTVTTSETPVHDKFYGKDVTLNGMQADLRITNLEQEDFGTYTLILKNEVGDIAKTLTFNAESEPSDPTTFTYKYEGGQHTFSWFGGFNGGHAQTFVIQTSIADQNSWKNITNVPENESPNNVEYTTDITTLSPGTYTARIFSWNSKGNSSYVNLNGTFTIKEVNIGGTELPVAAIVGGIVSAVALFAIVAVSFFIYRRRFGTKGGSQSKLNSGRAIADEDSDDEDEVNTVNPMYISADEVKPGMSDESTYAQPVKKKKQDTYAMVAKKPKNVSDDLNNLYAVPDKKGKQKQQKKGGLKKEKKEKKERVADGDVYENAPAKAVGSGSKNAFDENLYENPEVSAAAQKPAQKPKKNVNKDGLIYADLTFNDQPKGQKKLVIHGLDSMTEYVQVDFTKKAEPLPDSDEEK